MAESSANVSMTMSEYMRSTATGGSKPRNEFEHGDGLADSVIKDEKGPWTNEQKNKMILKFSQIVDKYVQLAFIKDDNILKINQKYVEDMCEGLDISIREDFFAHVFAPEYFSWRGKLLMTHAKNGKMLDIQAAIGKPANPTQSQGGLGIDEPAEDLNIIQQLLNKGGKK